MCCTSSMYVQLAEHWFVLLFVNPGTGVCMHRYSSTLAFADYMCALPPPPPTLARCAAHADGNAYGAPPSAWDA